MFGVKKKDHNVIKVEFFEGKNEEPFVRSNIPVEQLPDTFEINTTMHLGDEDWHVIAAEPAKKEDFKKAGKLKITLAKPETTMMDPKDILFSLPTINDALPAVEDGRSLENGVVFHEDDWRQCEFISRVHKDVITTEIKAIFDIHENYRQDSGFDKIHIRQVIINPLERTKITVEMLKTNFDLEKEYLTVAFNTAATSVVGGFALQTKSNWILWGYVDENETVQALNLAPMTEASLKEISKQVDAFIIAQDLYLLDWPRLFWCDGNERCFTEYAK